MRKLSLRLKHLSQEHQAVMHFVSAMREAQSETDADLGEICKRVRAVFAADLEPHFQEEERYALPKLRDVGRADLADEVFRQHEKMRLLSAQLEQPNTELLVQFVHMLQAHVELEENVVWEALDRAMAAPQEPSTAE